MTSSVWSKKRPDGLPEKEYQYWGVFFVNKSFSFWIAFIVTLSMSMFIEQMVRLWDIQVQVCLQVLTNVFMRGPFSECDFILQPRTIKQEKETREVIKR